MSATQRPHWVHSTRRGASDRAGELRLLSPAWLGPASDARLARPGAAASAARSGARLLLARAAEARSRSFARCKSWSRSCLARALGECRGGRLGERGRSCPRRDPRERPRSSDARGGGGGGGRRAALPAAGRRSTPPAGGDRRSDRVDERPLPLESCTGQREPWTQSLLPQSLNPIYTTLNPKAHKNPQPCECETLTQTLNPQPYTV